MGVFRGSGLNSTASCHSMLDFIKARCRAHSGAVGRALIDGRTPAMQLGIASEPLAFEDIHWPGQPVPRPSLAPAGAGDEGRPQTRWGGRPCSAAIKKEMGP